MQPAQFFTYLVEDRAILQGRCDIPEYLQTVQRPSGMGSMPGHRMIPPSQQRR